MGIRKLANTFREHYAKIFINSADEQTKVKQFNDMRLKYIGNTNTDSFVDINDIEAAMKNLKMARQLVLII